MAKKPLVKYTDETRPASCPYGTTQRVVTGGEGGVANVHVITVSKGTEHYHKGYDEVYYVLEGEGKIILDGKESVLRPGAVVVVPSGVVHSLHSNESGPIRFVIFGHPAMDVRDERFEPNKPL
ncbi:MAG: cupin domain-containing protein [Planctomycetota bacterium]|nr:cupin domain-containing protein [Planctomycetota bacterium]